MPDAPALIPDHRPTTTAEKGRAGGPTYSYRGAVITSKERGTLFAVTLAGCLNTQALKHLQC